MSFSPLFFFRGNARGDLGSRRFSPPSAALVAGRSVIGAGPARRPI